jgi:hypothetical protein
MQIQAPVITIGWIIALIVLLLVIVFIATGQVPVVIGLLIGGCALARLL